ncbi:MAG: hypothetical protein RIQ51_1155, partial [Bacteroidota bacterium]
MELAGKRFTIKDFLDRMNQIGSVPPAIGVMELTGNNIGILN